MWVRGLGHKVLGLRSQVLVNITGYFVLALNTAGVVVVQPVEFLVPYHGVNCPVWTLELQE